ncbi:MAG TPA: hypothetical protein VH280_01565 [Verrucomicrobiae bacterium]|jgi:hypothetical protein|nr:hypothetical protein [Verrucomicrobiae bacterium]
MNDPVSPTNSPDFADQVLALQRQVFLLLLALVVVTATLVAYLFYQSHLLNTELTDTKPTARQFIEEFNKNALVIKNFDKQLSDYALKHPSFQPVMRKYGWTPSNAPGAPAATAPAP